MTTCYLSNCPRTTDGHCALCNPRQYQIMTPLVGCICPPTSEQTCENPNCPRKPYRTSAAGVDFTTTRKDTP